MKIQKSPNDLYDYKYYKLKNNMELLICSSEVAEINSCSLNVSIGSHDEDLSGLAHFTEHALFMGTELYPNESEFSEFIAIHGGYYNAFTDSTNTCYHFELNESKFLKAFEIFTSFFHCPIFNESSLSREIEAVESEFQKGLNSDAHRMNRMQSLCLKEPFNTFSCGNKETLSCDDIRERMISFWKSNYSSSLMKIVIVCKPSANHELYIEQLEKIPEFFNEIENFQKNNIKPIYCNSINKNNRRIDIHDNLNGEKDIKLHGENSKSVTNEYFFQPEAPIIYQESYMNKIIHVDTIKPCENMTICTTIPRIYKLYKNNMFSFFEYFLTKDDMNTPIDSLKLKSFITAFYFDTTVNRDYCEMHFVFALTEEGYKEHISILNFFSQYLKHFRERLSDPMFLTRLKKEYYNLKLIKNKVFESYQMKKSSEMAVDISDSMQYYPIENVLNHNNLYEEFCLKELEICLDSILDVDKWLIFLESKKSFVNLSESSYLTEKHYKVNYFLKPCAIKELEAIERTAFSKFFEQEISLGFENQEIPKVTYKNNLEIDISEIKNNLEKIYTDFKNYDCKDKYIVSEYDGEDTNFIQENTGTPKKVYLYEYSNNFFETKIIKNDISKENRTYLTVHFFFDLSKNDRITFLIFMDIVSNVFSRRNSTILTLSELDFDFDVDFNGIKFNFSGFSDISIEHLAINYFNTYYLICSILKSNDKENYKNIFIDDISLEDLFSLSKETYRNVFERGINSPPYNNSIMFFNSLFYKNEVDYYFLRERNSAIKLEEIKFPQIGRIKLLITTDKITSYHMNCGFVIFKTLFGNNNVYHLADDANIIPQELTCVDKHTEDNAIYEFNTNDKINTCVSIFLVYPFDSNNIHIILLLKIIELKFSDQFFNDLRTKDCLGYVVYFCLRRETNKYVLHFCVQSKEKKEKLINRINDFIAEVKLTIQKLKNEYFSNNKSVYPEKSINLQEQNLKSNILDNNEQNKRLGFAKKENKTLDDTFDSKNIGKSINEDRPGEVTKEMKPEEAVTTDSRACDPAVENMDLEKDEILNDFNELKKTAIENFQKEITNIEDYHQFFEKLYTWNMFDMQFKKKICEKENLLQFYEFPLPQSIFTIVIQHQK